MNKSDGYRFVVVYCFDRDMMLLGTADTYDAAEKIMKDDFLKVFCDEGKSIEMFENEDGLSDDWWFASEIGEAWINGKGNHDWVILDTKSPF